MKIWCAYGSDHSANIVMIGEFKTIEDAERAYELIKTLSANASSDSAAGILNVWGSNEQMSKDTEERLRELKLYSLSPSDIADFAFLNTSIDRRGRILRFETDDVDIGAFVKLMVSQGAKVQVYSAHDYPAEEAN